MASPKKVLLAALTLVPILASAWILLARPSWHSPSLEAAALLGRQGRHDEAEALVEGFLKAHPADPHALLLRASTALERPEPRTELALELLARVRSRDPQLMARVELNRGRAFERQKAMTKAEASWRKALEYDPRVPEAGWSLLGLDYIQGRTDDARRLALQLHATEPDPHDRVQLLLELVRQEAQPPDPASLIPIFEPVVQRHPEDIHSAVALGLAMIRNSRGDEGLKLLRGLPASHPDDRACWAGLLEGLELANQGEELALALEQLPPSLSGNPQFHRYRGRVAQDRGDWKAAAGLYRGAFEFNPLDDSVLYRLGRALNVMGEAKEASRFDTLARARTAARDQVRGLYARADASMKARRSLPTDLKHEIADQREQSGHADEALAWHRLVLEHEPDDPTSRVAVERLAATTRDEAKRTFQSSGTGSVRSSRSEDPMNDDFASLYAYNRWADRRILEACRKLTPEQYGAEPVPGWSSVRSSIYTSRS